jgi:hypothetical protein
MNAARIPAAIRNKNPGAMWPGTIATKWGSRSYETLNDGQGNKIATFPTWVQGVAAQLDMWRTSAKYRNKAFKDAIHIWDGGNNTPSYIAYVLARVPGMTADTIMNDAFWNSAMGFQFLKAQAGHEAGQQMPITDAEWMEGQHLAFSGNPVSDDDDVLPLVRVGDSGPVVEKMQRLLNCAVTGRYKQRSETEYALRLFQIRNSLDPDGICGPNTWDKLQPES